MAKKLVSIFGKNSKSLSLLCSPIFCSTETCTCFMSWLYLFSFVKFILHGRNILLIELVENLENSFFFHPTRCMTAITNKRYVFDHFLKILLVHHVARSDYFDSRFSSSIPDLRIGFTLVNFLIIDYVRLKIFWTSAKISLNLIPHY